MGLFDVYMDGVDTKKEVYLSQTNLLE